MNFFLGISILITVLIPSFVSCNQESNKPNFVVNWKFIESDTILYQSGKIRQINYKTALLDEDDVIIKNQKDNPAVTAMDLNLGELVCMLNRIDKCH